MHVIETLIIKIIGICNVASSFVGSYPVTGSFSRYVHVHVCTYVQCMCGVLHVRVHTHHILCMYVCS